MCRLFAVMSETLSLRRLRVGFQKSHDIVNDDHGDRVSVTGKVCRLFGVVAKVIVAVAKLRFRRPQLVIVAGIASLLERIVLDGRLDFPRPVLVNLIIIFLRRTPSHISFDDFCKYYKQRVLINYAQSY